MLSKSLIWYTAPMQGSPKKWSDNANTDWLRATAKPTFTLAMTSNPVLSDDREHHGRDIDQDHHDAHRTVDLVPQREDKDQDRRGDQDREVDHRREVDLDRVDRSGHAEDQQDIEDIGADDIADRQTVFALARGDHRGHQLRQRGAQRDDRQTDQRL